jgi:hypothetical protein
MCRELLRMSYRRALWDPRKTEGHLFGDDRYALDCRTQHNDVSVTEASFSCALFCVFMAHVIYNLEQRVFNYVCYVKNSYKSCRRKFRPKLPDTVCPSGYKFQISDESSHPRHFN